MDMQFTASAEANPDEKLLRLIAKFHRLRAEVLATGCITTGNQATALRYELIYRQKRSDAIGPRSSSWPPATSPPKT